MTSGRKEDSFKRIAEYHLPRFQKALHEALMDLGKHYVETRHLYNASELTQLMHVHVRDRMQKNFKDVPGADTSYKAGRAFKVYIDGAPIGIPGHALFKCKKVSPRLLTASITTESVKRFNTQRPDGVPHVQLPISDWREPKTMGGVEPGHGNVGYIPNSFWTGFERLCVSYYTGVKSARLVADIPVVGSGNGNLIQLPLGELTQAPARKRVKPKQKLKLVDVERLADHQQKKPKQRIKRETAEPQPLTDRKRKKGNLGHESDS